MDSFCSSASFTSLPGQLRQIEGPLPFPSAKICLLEPKTRVPGLNWQRRLDLDSEPLERDEGGAPRGALGLAAVDRATEHVREDLRPRRIGVERAACCDHL